MAYLSLKDYGLIGNQASAALVSRLGSIDWCCMPSWDSPSHFGGLLDDNLGGYFKLCPVGEFRSEQRYRQRSNVLETTFETPDGRGVLTDWMPVRPGLGPEPILHRQIEVLDGEMAWTLQCWPRFRYGEETAQAEFYRDCVLFRGAHPSDLAILQSHGDPRGTFAAPLQHDERSARATYSLKAGQSLVFSWIWGRHGRLREIPNPRGCLEYWRDWAHRCSTTVIRGGAEPRDGRDAPLHSASCLYSGPWHDQVTRSSLALKMMIDHFSGAISESVTTSLPTLAGGSRNWDHRYAWMRNSANAYSALQWLGHGTEAAALFEWMADLVIRDGAESLQGVYSLDGGRFIPEKELPQLSGYAGSRPVRIGNLSARQFQLDAFGYVMMACEQRASKLGPLPTALWQRLIELTEYVCQAWRRPDRGPWEVRTRPEHFVASKVLCWVALDRAIKLCAIQDAEVPNRWRQERETLHRTICEQGYDPQRKSFVRAFGDRELDAAVLQIPLVGFLPIEDERVQHTLHAIREELSDGSLLHRYRPLDGLPESDGAHLLCSFWYVACLAKADRVDEASDRLAELCTFATPLGLFGEQVDPTSGEPAGNFPSSAAHLALVSAAYEIGVARQRARGSFIEGVEGVNGVDRGGRGDRGSAHRPGLASHAAVTAPGVARDLAQRLLKVGKLGRNPSG